MTARLKHVLVTGVMGLMLGGCGGARSPEGAVRALQEAAETGDRDAVWQLLGPATRARLTADAQKAAQAAGRRELSGRDLLAAGWSAPRWHAAEYDVLAADSSSATVEVRGPAHERETLRCVRQGSQWTVELP
jgi:hypothetical protein